AKRVQRECNLVDGVPAPRSRETALELLDRLWLSRLRQVGIAAQPVKDRLKRRRGASLPGVVREVCLPQRPFVIAGKNGGLCDADAGFLFEARRFDLAETLDRLAEQRQCIL